MTAARSPTSPAPPAPQRRLAPAPPPLGKCSSPIGAGQWLFCGELAGSPALNREPRRQLQPLDWRAANLDSRPLLYRRPRRLEIDEWQQPPIRRPKSLSLPGRCPPVNGGSASPHCPPTLPGPNKSYSTPNLQPTKHNGNCKRMLQRPRLVPIVEQRRPKRSRPVESNASQLSHRAASNAQDEISEHSRQKRGEPKSMHEWGLESDEETVNKELERTLPRSHSSPLGVPSLLDQGGHNEPTRLGYWHDVDQAPAGKLRSSASTPLHRAGSAARKHRDKSLERPQQGDESSNRNIACTTPQAADTVAIHQSVESELSKLHMQYSSLCYQRTPRLLEEELIST